MTQCKNCILRLSKYKNSLKKLKALGFKKVFSDNLADAIEVTSSQVRKDFSEFNITGSKRGGYLVDDLLEKIEKILGKDVTQSVIIVGAGNLGQALMNYDGFAKEQIKIEAAFDINPNKINTSAEIPIYPLDNLCDFVIANKISTGIITVPSAAVQQVADLLISSGIKGILNFAPVNIKGTESCIINNVNFIIELENLFYRINQLKWFCYFFHIIIVVIKRYVVIASCEPEKQTN